jgi:signal transduction histidine kinase/ligand-binding sensor domain-containing protein
MLAADAVPASDDYVLRTWDVDDGLPSDTISGITQTPDGYLWLATSGGLARFDGVRFTTFLSQTTPGIASDQIGTVFAARTGDLWLTFKSGGGAVLHEGNFEPILAPAKSTVPVTSITSIAEDAEGAVWFNQQSRDAVVRWKNGEFSQIDAGKGVGIAGELGVCADGEGRIWLLTLQGCAIFDGQSIRPIADDKSGGAWLQLATARGGGMWELRWTKGRVSLVRYKANGTQETMGDLTSLVKAVAINSMFEDREGNLWLATRGMGLIRWRNGALVRVPTSQNNILAVAEDREGNIWAGTSGGGLNRLRLRGFYMHKADEGLYNDHVVSVCEDTEGKLWLAPTPYPPVRATDAGNRSFTTPPGWGVAAIKGTVTALCADPAGGVWIACSNGRLLHWRDGAYALTPPHVAALGLLVDRQGDLWAAAARGALIRLRDESVVSIPRHGVLFDARALAEDTAGRIWVGNERGMVFQGRNDRFSRVPLPGAKPGEPVRFIAPDENDTVWIGTFGSGLYRCRAGQVARIPENAGFDAGDLRSLLIEPDGTFWIGTGRGLYSISRSEIEAGLDDRRKPMQVTRYERDDGLPSTEFELGYHNAVARAHDGHLWFATTQGALEIIPQNVRKDTPPEKVLIEDIRIGQRSLPPDSRNGFTLPPVPGPLQISYTLPQLCAPDLIRFRYRLTGSGDDEWLSNGTQRTVVFAHLQAGTYRFAVQAAEGDGPWMPATASVAFSVRPGWWETWWFHASAEIASMLAFGWLVLTVMRRRFRARMRRIEQERALERERARIARDMHDELGASLTQISIASELAKLDPAEEMSSHIEDIGGIARHAVTALDEIVWAINPRNDTLSALFEYLGQYAIDFLSAAGIACELEIPAELPAHPLAAQTRHHLFLAVKEALNNIVKHAGATAVHLKVELTRDVLRITVADNGRGFREGPERAGSDGLGNMRERMEEAGGKCKVESHPGEGSRILFEMALPDAARTKVAARK